MSFNVNMCIYEIFTNHASKVGSKCKAAFATHQQTEDLGFIGLYETKMLVTVLFH